MARLTVELDIPGLETRSSEVWHIRKALLDAAQDIAMHGGTKHGRHEISLPGDRPGDPRKVLGTWTFTPRATA